MATMTELIPACKTSTHRSIRWTPASDPGDPASGTLVVWDGPDSRPRRRCYAVVEVVPGKGFAGTDDRCFLVVKADHTAYEAVVGRTSHSCTCAAGCFGRVESCCHVLGLRALIENGWLPHPQDRPDPDPLPDLDTDIDLAPTCPRCCEGRLFEDADGSCRCDRCGYAS